MKAEIIFDRLTTFVLRTMHCGNRGYEKSWYKVSLKLVKCPFHNSKTAIFGIHP